MNGAESESQMFCCVCLKGLQVGETFLQCTVETCSKLYHQQCTNMPQTVSEQDSWICSECVYTSKRGRCSCEKLVGSPHVNKNITHRKKPPSSPLPTKENVLTTSSVAEVLFLRNQMSKLSEQLKSAVSTIAHYEVSMMEMMINIKEINEKLMTIQLNSICKCRGSNEPAPPTMVGEPAKALMEVNATISKRKRSRDNRKKRSGADATSACKELTELSITKAHPNLPANDACSSAQYSHCCGEISPAIEHVQQDVSTGWKEVQYKKRNNDSVRAVESNLDPHNKKQKTNFKRTSASIVCTAGPDITSLKAVEHRKYVHLWNMLSGAEEVQSYLVGLCPDVTCTVEDLKPRGDYKSFKIGVPPAYYDKCLSPNTWPSNARIKPWLFRGSPNNKKQ